MEGERYSLCWQAGHLISTCCCHAAGLADDLARPFTVTILSPVLMASRKASGDGRGKKSKSKKIKAEPTYETVSDDEPEANAGDYGVPLIYDFVPNIGNGDVVMGL